MRSDVRFRRLLAAALLMLFASAGFFFARARRSPPPRPVATDQIAVAVPPVPAPESAPTRDQRDVSRRDKDNNEHDALRHLRELAVSDPRHALVLSAELDRRFPNGAFAEERASLVIDALVNLGDIGQARAKSEEYFVRFRNGRFGLHVETLTGVHPHRAFDEAPGN
jgi:hypothetical protein